MKGICNDAFTGSNRWSWTGWTYYFAATIGRRYPERGPREAPRHQPAAEVAWDYVPYLGDLDPTGTNPSPSGAESAGRVDSIHHLHPRAQRRGNRPYGIDVPDR